MKQKLLFLALMAVSSQSLLSHYHHGGYGRYGGLGFGYGGPGFGLYVGNPGYGYFGPGFYPGYYGGPIVVHEHNKIPDPNKARRQQLAGQIFDANEELSSLKESKATSSQIQAKEDEIRNLNKSLNNLKV